MTETSIWTKVLYLLNLGRKKCDPNSKVPGDKRKALRNYGALFCSSGREITARKKMEWFQVGDEIHFIDIINKDVFMENKYKAQLTLTGLDR